MSANIITIISITIRLFATFFPRSRTDLMHLGPVAKNI